MKTRKDRTEPLSCRVPEEMKIKIKEMADTLEMSLAQYVEILVDMGFQNESSQDLYQRFNLLNGKFHQNEKELAELRNLSSCLAPPFSNSLNSVLNNEQILNNLYTHYKTTPVQRERLISMGFKFNVMLEALTHENSTFYFMGNFGWAFQNDSRINVIIRKRS